MVERDDLHVTTIAAVGAVSVLLTIATIFGVEALYRSFANRETQRKVIAAPTPDSDSKLAEQEARLNRYSWVNREQAIVTIPIERAMDIVARELRAQQRSTASSLPTVARSQ